MKICFPPAPNNGGASSPFFQNRRIGKLLTMQRIHRPRSPFPSRNGFIVSAGREGGQGVRFLTLLLLFSHSIAFAQSKQHEPAPSPINARAVKILSDMVETYKTLPVLKQQTEFYSAILPIDANSKQIPLPQNEEPDTPAMPQIGIVHSLKDAGEVKKPDARASRKLDRILRLAYKEPNRLWLEMQEKSEKTLMMAKSQWVSDGKHFWSYNSEKNIYSKEKAPGNIHDFTKLTHLSNGSLEMLMLMGVNPFAEIGENVDELRYDGSVTVRDVETDIILLRVTTGQQITEMRLYIGTEDHLLRRMVNESWPKPKPASLENPGGGVLLDELAPAKPIVPVQNNSALQPDDTEDFPSLPGLPVKTQVSYENIITLEPEFEKKAFSYIPPAGAFVMAPQNVKYKPRSIKQQIADINRSFKRSKNQVQVIRQ